MKQNKGEISQKQKLSNVELTANNQVKRNNNNPVK